MLKTIQILCLASLLPLLAACADLNSAAKPQAAGAEAKEAMISQPVKPSMSGCPSVGIVEDLRSMTLFTDNNRPSPDGIMAYGKIEDFDGGCVFENGTVTIELDLMFSARMGPKGKVGRGDPSIAFPYFIAISDDQGNILNKEVFATAIRFTDGLDSAHRVEHLKPRIPISNPALAPRYQVLVGFQLNREQLSFNRGGQ